MRLGYARVSTEDQSLDLQIDALKKAGCAKIFQDHGVSGVSEVRPGFDDIMIALQPGDELVVWRLDRLARSMFDLIDFLHTMRSREIVFRSLCEGMDTSSAFGEAIYAVASVFAHLERSIMIERTRAGMAAAKARGVQFGRRRALTSEKIQKLNRMRCQGIPMDEIASALCISRSTLFRYTQERRTNQDSIQNLTDPPRTQQVESSD